MAYKPMMSRAEAKRRLAWQERIYTENLKRTGRILIDFNGGPLVILRGVFEPVPWDKNLLAHTVLREVTASDKVLDMGTGSGVQAILAASRSPRVTAADVNPCAVRCAKINVTLNRMFHRVKVVESDLFRNVKGRYDVIIFDPPYRWSKPRSMWERSTADENYGTLQTFLREARQYLKMKGRIVVTFGTSGDIAYFKHLVRKNGFRRTQILKSSNGGWTYFTYRLTC